MAPSVHPGMTRKINMNKRLIIGVTGPIHSGKSTVSSYLESKGFLHFDADKIAHDFYLTGEGIHTVETLFGPETIDDSKVDINKLRDALKANPNLKEPLTNKVWAYVKRKAKNLVDSRPNDSIILDVPLLYDSKMYEDCDLVILVLSSQNLRKTRLLLEGRDADTLLKINENYPLNETKAIADIVITNDGSKEDLYQQIDAFLKHEYKCDNH